MTKNQVSGLIAVVIGSVYLFLALLIPRAAIGDKIGPKMFPILVGIIAVVCGALLFLRELKITKEDLTPFDWAFGAEKQIYTKIVITIILGIIYGFTLRTAGYVITTMLFMLAITWLINGRHWIENTLISLLFPVVTYTVFAIMLGLSLPRGWLSFLPF
ncbi:MAG: tripartite tricarboxylate transporter TctB family protein [Thermovirgaceae bacterium]